jgi:L-iditol 2-dehydrogenase
VKVLVLEDVAQFALRDWPKPEPKPAEALIEVSAVGICGTDLHIYDGSASYQLDSARQPVTLRRNPLVLGHEICGAVEAVGNAVTNCRPGDRVIVDQVLNCFSQGRRPPCEYCASGDSHQCEFGEELGITGRPGAFADYIAVPAVNVVKVPDRISSLDAAVAEPLACVAHAIERLERGGARYRFNGGRRIGSVVILGAGPSGLLFIQFLRSVMGFNGDLWVVDSRDARLALARDFGAVPVDLRSGDPANDLRRKTGGEGVHCVIEASGSGAAIDLVPRLARRQASVLLYGSGHAGLSDGCLTPFQATELHLITTAGASGGFDPDGTPTAYRTALEHIAAGRIDVSRLVTHRFTALSEIPDGFRTQTKAADYIKGALVLDEQA